MIEISVIIITYNRADLLELSLNSILKQDYKDYEIIVIDDGSTDKTKTLVKSLKKKYSNIKYFYHTNKGWGYSRNAGLEKAKGEIIAFTDDDCIAGENWLKKIKESFDKNFKISAVGGSILNTNKSNFAWAAHILNFSDWCTIRRKKFLKDCPTTNIAYKKNDIKGIKFPVKYGNLGYEDSLFNYRLIKNHKNILFDPSIKVYHNPKINSYKSFLKNQRIKGLSFLMRGYKVHGFLGRFLVKFKFLNLFCPRLILIFLRCLRSPKYFYRFIIYFPLIFRGELERGLTILNRKFHNIM